MGLFAPPPDSSPLIPSSFLYYRGFGWDGKLHETNLPLISVDCYAMNQQIHTTSATTTVVFVSKAYLSASRFH